MRVREKYNKRERGRGGEEEMRKSDGREENRG